MLVVSSHSLSFTLSFPFALNPPHLFSLLSLFNTLFYFSFLEKENSKLLPSSLTSCLNFSVVLIETHISKV